MTFEDLSPELKEEALAKAEGIDLTNEQLESISGGGWKHPSCPDDTAWTYAC